MNAGCDWFTAGCIDKNTDTSNFDQYFCHASTDDGCSHDYAFPAVCYIWDYPSNLPVQWFDDKSVGGYHQSDYCPIRQPPSYSGQPNDYYALCQIVQK